MEPNSLSNHLLNFKCTIAPIGILYTLYTFIVFAGYFFGRKQYKKITTFKKFFFASLFSFISIFLPFAIAIIINYITKVAFFAQYMPRHSHDLSFLVWLYENEKSPWVVITTYLRIAVFAFTPYIAAKHIANKYGSYQKKMVNLFLGALAAVCIIWNMSSFPSLYVLFGDIMANGQRSLAVLSDSIWVFLSNGNYIKALVFSLPLLTCFFAFYKNMEE